MSSYRTEVLADNPILYLRCEEPSGATVADIGSLGGNATANGTFTRNVTNAGGAGLGVGISFPGGTGNYIQKPYNVALDAGNFTYELWCQCDDFAALHYLMSAGRDDSSTAGYSLYLFTDRSLQIWRAGTAALFSGGVIYPNDANWHYIAVRRSSDIYKMYVDGAPAATSGTVSTGVGGSHQDFCIGRELIGGVAAGFHKGDVDEVAVYNTALSDARILAHYEARDTATDSTFVPRIAILT